MAAKAAAPPTPRVPPELGGRFAVTRRSRLRCLAVLAGFSELNPQIARDVRQTALAGPPMLALPSAADGAARAVLGPCGNRR